MPYRTIAKNLMLDALCRGAAPAKSITLVSLHTGFPATDGNELTGGSPAYARKAIAYDPASGGSSDDTAAARVFDVPAGASVAAVGFRAADGTLLADGQLTLETFNAQGTLSLTDTDLDLNAA